MFKLGQRVTCIDDTFAPPYGEATPVAGRVYTVRNIVGPCIRLREIVNRPEEYREGTIECSFRADRFTARKGKP